MNTLQTSENNDPDMLDINLLRKNSTIKFKEIQNDLVILYIIHYNLPFINFFSSFCSIRYWNLAL